MASSARLTPSPAQIWLWRRQSRYVSAHEQCPHRDAIAKDPAFYDDWLRPKFVEFCAAQGWDGGDLVVDPADIEPDVVTTTNRQQASSRG